MSFLDDAKAKVSDVADDVKNNDLVEKAEAMAAEHGITKEEAMEKIKDKMAHKDE